VGGTALGGSVALTDLVGAHVAYYGRALWLTLDDHAGHEQTFTWTIDVPGALGTRHGYWGFTGSTSNRKSRQTIAKFQLVFDPG
jgi:hypothetical protein